MCVRVRVGGNFRLLTKNGCKQRKLNSSIKKKNIYKIEFFGDDTPKSFLFHLRMYANVCVYTYICVCVHICVCMCVCVCER